MKYNLSTADFVNQEVRHKAITARAYELWYFSNKDKESNFYWYQAAEEIDKQWLFAYMNSFGYEENEKKLDKIRKNK